MNDEGVNTIELASTIIETKIVDLVMAIVQEDLARQFPKKYLSFVEDMVTNIPDPMQAQAIWDEKLMHLLMNLGYSKRMEHLKDEITKTITRERGEMGLSILNQVSKRFGPQRMEATN